jgi:integrase
MRAAEARQLKVSDIDGSRILVFIRHGKGGRQRYVMLSTQLREILRAYRCWRKPQDWLFPSAQHPSHALDVSAFRRICRVAGKRAGLTRRVYPHLFRHYVPFRTMSGNGELQRI